MAFRNIKAEMKRYEITQGQVAKSMNMSTNNLNLKINEKIPMTVDEAKFIQRHWLPEVTLDALLESDGDKPTTPNPDGNYLTDERKTVRA